MYLAEATRSSDRIWGEGMPRAASKLFLIALAVLALFGQMFAQGGATGAITGTVLDPSGAVVAGAEVRIVNQGHWHSDPHHENGQQRLVYRHTAAGRYLHHQRHKRGLSRGEVY